MLQEEMASNCGEILSNRETAIVGLELSTPITTKIFSRGRSMNRDDYMKAWMAASQSGNLLTPKHDPANLSTPNSRFRTVTCMSPLDIAQYIESGDYDIRVFVNNAPKHPPHFCEIIPKEQSIVTGSSVLPWSNTPTSGCDRFVVVSGNQLGWHLYAESSANIHAKQQAGQLSLNYEFLAPSQRSSEI